MALQGDLNSFALPDVLRLLAGTGKSGRLEIDAAHGTGELLLNAGTIVASSVSTAPHAVESADVVYELLCFESGAFLFDERDQPGRPGESVERVIAAAEGLVVEWADVQTVVPSLDAWLTLAPEIDDDIIELTADQWRALAAIGGGANVRDLAGALELSDLAASKQVKFLVESALVSLRATHGYAPAEQARPAAAMAVSHGYQPPEIQLDSFEEFEVHEEAPLSELDDLMVEDRPVVMEDREDALLPEPLPGEGVVYEGEISAEHVDGRTFDVFETFDSAPDHTAPAGSFDMVAQPVFDVAEPVVEEALAAEPAPAGETAFEDMVFGAEPQGLSPEAAALGAVMFGEAPAPEVAPIAEAPATLAEHMGSNDDIEMDEERGSLLKFLSSVKP